MKIACLGWGSLVWDPRDLPMKSAWQKNGPEISVEFCRQSDNGRVTLVVTPDAKSLTTLWCEMDSTTLEDAIAKLADREKVTAKNAPTRIGRWPTTTERSPHVPENLAGWAETNAIDGVVWTALPPRFNGEYVTPSCEQVVAYLKTTMDTVRADCERYIRRAPIQIDTAYRRAIVQELGWTPIIG